MIDAELYVTDGKHSGQVIPLNRRKFLIGREHDCQLRPNSEMVSRHHCVFSIDNFSVRLRDLGSTNGTLVNGNRVLKEVTLVEGDRIIVGNLEFEFRASRSAASDLPAEETVVASEETVMVMTAPAATEEPAGDNPQEAAPSNPAEPPVDQPQPTTADTTVAQNPVMPGQVPYQPMMSQPMGFPGQMYGGYPYQPHAPMPMYPQGYPQPMMPGVIPGYPQAPVLAAGSAEAAAVQEVSLPDPSETGAEEPADHGGSKGGQSTESTNAAADIIRRYTHRRPG